MSSEQSSRTYGSEGPTEPWLVTAKVRTLGALGVGRYETFTVYAVDRFSAICNAIDKVNQDGELEWLRCHSAWPTRLRGGSK